MPDGTVALRICQEGHANALALNKDSTQIAVAGRSRKCFRAESSPQFFVDMNLIVISNRIATQCWRCYQSIPMASPKCVICEAAKTKISATHRTMWHGVCWIKIYWPRPQRMASSPCGIYRNSVGTSNCSCTRNTSEPLIRWHSTQPIRIYCCPVRKTAPSSASTFAPKRLWPHTLATRRVCAMSNSVRLCRTCLPPYRKMEPSNCGIWSERTDASNSSPHTVARYTHVIGIRRSNGWPQAVATSKSKSGTWSNGRRSSIRYTQLPWWDASSGGQSECITLPAAHWSSTIVYTCGMCGDRTFRTRRSTNIRMWRQASRGRPIRMSCCRPARIQPYSSTRSKMPNGLTITPIHRGRRATIEAIWCFRTNWRTPFRPHRPAVCALLLWRACVRVQAIHTHLNWIHSIWRNPHSWTIPHVPFT